MFVETRFAQAKTAFELYIKQASTTIAPQHCETFILAHFFLGICCAKTNDDDQAVRYLIKTCELVSKKDNLRPRIITMFITYASFLSNDILTQSKKHFFTLFQNYLNEFPNFINEFNEEQKITCAYLLYSSNLIAQQHSILTLCQSLNEPSSITELRKLLSGQTVSDDFKLSISRICYMKGISNAKTKYFYEAIAWYPKFAPAYHYIALDKISNATLELKNTENPINKADLEMAITLLNQAILHSDPTIKQDEIEKTGCVPAATLLQKLLITQFRLCTTKLEFDICKTKYDSEYRHSLHKAKTELTKDLEILILQCHDNIHNATDAEKTTTIESVPESSSPGRHYATMYTHSNYSANNNDVSETKVQSLTLEIPAKK